MPTYTGFYGRGFLIDQYAGKPSAYGDVVNWLNDFGETHEITTYAIYDIPENDMLYLIVRFKITGGRRND